MSKEEAGGHLFIPDLHGHLPRLEAALAVARRFPGVRLVFLGDLIDDSPFRRSARGDHREKGTPDDSPEVLRIIRRLHDQGQADVLLGNHEVMAIQAVIGGNWEMQNIWWQHGGRETAAGYGWRPGGEGPLVDDLHWLKEQGRLFVTAGPAGAQVLAGHATRPHAGRVAAGMNRFEQMVPQDDFDPVVWYPLGQDEESCYLHTLPVGCVASVHGHMLQDKPRQLFDREGSPSLQLDLHPAKRKLAVLHLSAEGQQKVMTHTIR